MHVAMITREFPPGPGGIGSYVYNLSKVLINRGHKVTVFSRGTTSKSFTEVIDGISVFRITFFPLYPFHIAIHRVFMERLFQKHQEDFDIIHAHSPVVPAWNTSLPVITTVHTPMKVDARYHEMFDIRSAAQKMQSEFFSPFYEKRSFRKSKLITAVSTSVARELSFYGYNPETIPVIWNGVDENLFNNDSSKNSQDKYVLYTGSLHARKGLFDLLKSAEYVCEAYPDIKFLVCGTGPFRKKILDNVHKRGMQDKFKLLGFVPKKVLVDLYKNATVHVVPSHYEGMPTVLLEGMACGLPEVATNVGGSGEVIKDGVNGFIVPPKNPSVMSERILQLLNDDKLRRSMGKAARETIENGFTWNKITDRIIQCYEQLIQ